MKASRYLLLALIVAVGSGFVAGLFVAGRNVHRSGDGHGESGASQAARRTSQGTTSHANLHEAEPARALRNSTAEHLESAVRSAFNATTTRRRDDALRALAESIGLSEIPAVLQRLTKSPHLEVRSAITDRLLERWAKVDTPAALAFAQGLPHCLWQEWPVFSVVREWADSDSSAAGKWIAQQPASPQKWRLQSILVEEVAAKSPEDALALLDSFDKVPNETEVRRAVFAQWAKTDPVAAAAAVSDLESGDSTALSLIARHWARDDPAAAIRWVSSNQRLHDDPMIMGRLCAALADRDPRLAAETAWSLPQGPVQTGALNGVATSLAQADLDQAIDWIQALPDGEGKAQAFDTIGMVWMESDPKAATEFAASLSTRPDRSFIVGRSLGRWAQTDPAGAAIWARQFSGEDYDQPNMMRTVLTEWASVSPVDAADFVAGHLQGDGQKEHAGQVLSVWAQKDPASAVAWLARFPEGPAWEHGVEQVVSSWAQRNRAAVEDWLRTQLPAGTGRETAVLAYIHAQQVRDPIRAIEWTQALVDQRKGMAEAEGILGHWFERDKAGASRWLTTSTLPMDIKARLLEQQPQ